MAKNCNLLTFFNWALIFTFMFSGVASAQKMSSNEIVAKHLEAIGKAETRKSLKNHVASGNVSFTILRQAGVGGDGKIVLGSEGIKSLFGMSFNIPTYPGETIVFDGKKFKVAFAINNARSPLGDYLYRYSDTIKEGLLGGTLSIAWPLNDLASRKAKLDFDGTKKINDREAYNLSYSPKGGSDLQIHIFIDKETFQHLRTEYRRTISASQGASPDASSQKRERIENLTEDFSDFKAENGLMLPHKYRLYLMLEGQSSGTKEYEWKAELTQFFINQPLDPASFSVESK
jgi:hypothetical protein